ncbi:MAG: hypothetical protein HY747_02520 [Elusimicrobia bacterium]|nr:hypothetical protein [Elusimicrobiota bacterium]
MKSVTAAFFRKIKQKTVIANLVMALLVFSSGFGIPSVVYFADQQLIKGWEERWPAIYFPPEEAFPEMPDLPDLIAAAPMPESAAPEAPLQMPPIPRLYPQRQTQTTRSAFTEKTTQILTLIQTKTSEAPIKWPKDYTNLLLCIIGISFLGIPGASFLVRMDAGPMMRFLNTLTIFCVFCYSLIFLYRGFYHSTGSGSLVGIILGLAAAGCSIYGCYNSYLEKET